MKNLATLVASLVAATTVVSCDSDDNTSSNTSRQAPQSSASCETDAIGNNYSLMHVNNTYALVHTTGTSDRQTLGLRLFNGF